ncbi:hypothetical protein LTR94_027772 [Friedmanniomyces endolithicus]|nr:hypothetical protein LTR94_027772 [Friedmanniomyces endolithicus]
MGPLIERVFTAFCNNDYGEFDGLISVMSETLGREGLVQLRSKFEAMATNPPKRPVDSERRIIGYGMNGPLYADQIENNHHPRLVKAALAQIADALSDVDAYIDLFSQEERTRPNVAAEIAKRLLAAQRPDEALQTLALIDETARNKGYWPDLTPLRIEALQAAGRIDEAQQARWAAFQTNLNPDPLRGYLKGLPDFDDLEAEDQALDIVQAHAHFDNALAFLINWPAIDRAAVMVLSRASELNGNNYWLLNLAADAFDQRHPLAATLALRAMIDFTLSAAKHTRYRHGMRHLKTCELLARQIADYASHLDHEAYVADLRHRHPRKTAFWSASPSAYEGED